MEGSRDLGCFRNVAVDGGFQGWLSLRQAWHFSDRADIPEAAVLLRIVHSISMFRSSISSTWLSIFAPTSWTDKIRPELDQAMICHSTPERVAPPRLIPSLPPVRSSHGRRKHFTFKDNTFEHRENP